jgi:hypothetical protein
MSDMRTMTGWTRIPCMERDEHYDIAGEHLKPLSSLTDLDGEFGSPVVFTEWGRDDQDEPLLRDYRYPKQSDPGSDYRPCEHYFYTGA